MRRPSCWPPDPDRRLASLDDAPVESGENHAGTADALDAPGAGLEAARGGTLRVGAFLAGQLVTLGAIALLFRHIGVAYSGSYVTVLSLVSIVGAFTDLCLTT